MGWKQQIQSLVFIAIRQTATYTHAADMHLDAPKEAGGEVQGAEEQGHQLGQAYCGRIDVQIRLYESAMRAYRHIQRCGTSISWRFAT
jgi:hypothetical protein